eukprot:g15071.t1
MASDDLLHVDAGGMVRKDKGNTIAVREGREGVKAEVRKMGQNRLRALSTMVLGNPRLRKKVVISEAPLLKLASSENIQQR